MLMLTSVEISPTKYHGTCFQVNMPRTALLSIRLLSHEKCILMQLVLCKCHEKPIAGLQFLDLSPNKKSLLSQNTNIWIRSHFQGSLYWKKERGREHKISIVFLYHIVVLLLFAH